MNELITSQPDLKGEYPRSINLNQNNRGESFCTNVVITSRYSAINFIPKNLWEQFHQPSNLYFLCIGIAQSFKEVSVTNGVPTIFLPLAFIVLVSAIRAALEDYQRHVMDDKENNRPVNVVRSLDKIEFETIKCADVRVGDIVKVTENTDFPADIVCLSSSNPKGAAYVETASLDGETGLKPKCSVTYFQSFLTDSNLAKLENVWLGSEEPNSKLGHFRGRIVNSNNLEQEEASAIGLEVSQLLLRGTILKNTSFILGVVVYTGSDTKIRKNCEVSISTKFRSNASLTLDKYMTFMLIFQLICCLVAGITDGVLINQLHRTWYLHFSATTVRVSYEIFTRTITWIIILSQMVPISLLVSMELVKTGQGIFMRVDKTLSIRVQNTAINEDLGQVEYLFSDKTGTLTQNRLEFKAAVVPSGVGFDVHGTFDTEIARRVRARTSSGLNDNPSNVSPPATPYYASLGEFPFTSDGIPFKKSISIIKNHSWSYLINNLTESADKNMFSLEVIDGIKRIAELDIVTRRFLIHLAISNTITPVEINGIIEYQATSPDELALCQYSSKCGFEFLSLNPTTLKITNASGMSEFIEFERVGVIEFNSKRKRVTVIYKHGSVIHVMCKGADNVICSILTKSDEDFNSGKVDRKLYEMSCAGLRTLVFCFSELPLSWWNTWSAEFLQISSQPEIGASVGHSIGSCRHDCNVCDFYDRMESSAKLKFLGISGLEDKLSELVPEAIEDFLVAGIKVWMLTGDKRETALNIGLACNLIDPPDLPVFSGKNILVRELPRYCEIIGKWFLIKNRTEDIWSQISASISNSSPLEVSSSELIQYLEKLGAPISDETLHLLAKSAIINKQDFFNWWDALDFTYLDAVIKDIENGMKLVALAEERKFDAISMLIDGKAISALYPPSRNSPASALSPSSSSAGSLGFDFSIDREDAVLVKARELFFNLAALCKSVVACRLTPDQKALIVSEIKARKSALTCSIGDGANDELMIRMANVGIGIFGLEGSAAARAADYAISKFRYLHTLLFVYGFWNHRRISSLIYYIFYKSLVCALVNFFFGFHSEFSGNNFINDFLFQLYSVIFSAAPVIVLAIFDQPLSREILEDSPILYFSISRNRLFTLSKFFRWLITSVIHALICFYMTYFSLALYGVASSFGSTVDAITWSTCAFTAVVFMVNIQIIFYMHSITIVHAIAACGSIILYLIVIVVFSKGDLMLKYNSAFYGVSDHFYSSPLVWLSILLVVGFCLVVSFLIEHVQRVFYPTLLDIFKERSDKVLSPIELRNISAEDKVLVGRISAKLTRENDPLWLPNKIYVPETFHSIDSFFSSFKL